MECADRTFYIDIVGTGCRDEIAQLSMDLSRHYGFRFSLCHAFQLGQYLILNDWKSKAKFADKVYILAKILDIKQSEMRIKQITLPFLIWDADHVSDMDAEDIYDNILLPMIVGEFDDNDYGEYTIRVDLSEDHECELCK